MKEGSRNEGRARGSWGDGDGFERARDGRRKRAEGGRRKRAEKGGMTSRTGTGGDLRQVEGRAESLLSRYCSTDSCAGS
jgi:hypothetical protein